MRFACLFLLLWVFPVVSAAQNVSPDLIDPGKELRDRLEREQTEEEIRRFQPSQGAIEPSLVNPEKPDDGPCVPINDIQVEGVTLLSKRDMKILLAGRSPGCLGRYHISNLMRSIDKAYIDKGYITARTYIPAQDIQASKILKLQVVEGRVEGVKLFRNEKEIAKSPNALAKWTAFLNREGQYLNVRDFEQGLEQMNRQASITAKMRLEPGEKPGGSVVVVEQAVKDRFRGFLGYDNLGSQSTGERQLRLQLSADGVFSANDVGSFIYIGSENANAVNAALSMPVGYNTLTASGSLSDFLIPLSDISELLTETQSYSVSLDRVLRRDAQSITNISAAVRYRQSERFINGVALQPQALSVGDIRLRQIQNTKSARWSWEIGVRAGLPWFGGQTDIGHLPADQSHAEFQALDFSITRLGRSQKQGRWNVSLRGQVSTTALFGNEQFSLGSQSSVRGFKEPLLGGDSGAAVRVDGSFSMPKLNIIMSQVPEEYAKIYKTIAGKSGLYLSWDFGGAHSFGRDEYRLASGVSAGYRYYAKKVQFDLGVQSGIADIGENRLRKGDTWITGSVRLKTF